MDAATSTFTERLVLAIKKRNITKTNLALMINVSPSSISGWLNGKMPALENLISICKILNISANWLVNNSGPMSLYGPHHISKDQETLIASLRLIPKGSIAALTNFMAVSTGAGDSEALKKRVYAARALNKSDIAMVVVDKRGALLDINSSYLEVLNLKPENRAQVIGTSFIDWVPREQRVSLMLHITEAIERGHSSGYYCDHIRFGGSSLAPILMSGVFHDAVDDGIFLATAFPLRPASLKAS